MAQVPLSTRFIGIAQDVAIPENKTNILNNKTEPYTISDLIDTIGTASQGPEGPQGVQGPAGPPGPVGPAGLNWQGSWNKFNSYVEDDAVGYGGASYFCISDIEGGSSNANPEEDTTHWALLASQGAQGIQGVQGPTGPQGAQGPAGEGVTKVLKTTITSAQVLNLFTTPITILNSNNPLTLAYPLNVYVKRNAGDAYTLAVNTFNVINDLGIPLCNMNPNPLVNTTVGYFQAPVLTNQNLSGGNKNSLYKLRASTANPTGGTGDLDVYVTYVEFAL